MDVLHCLGTEDPLFGLVQEIRGDGSDRTRYEYDDYSHHYLLRWEGKPLGALTVQAAVDGKLDCDDYYPPVLFDRYRSQLIATCKLRIRRGPSTPIQALRTLVRGAWADQLNYGKRVSIVNADVRMQAFYRRIGFTYLPGFDFVHPELQTQSNVLLMAADSTQRSYCQDLFATVANQPNQPSLVELCHGPTARTDSMRLAGVA